MSPRTNFSLISIIILIISLIYTLIYFVYYHIENDVNIKNNYKTKALYSLYILIVILSLYIGYVLIKNLGKKLERSMRF
jgi:hypothetical protein